MPFQFLIGIKLNILYLLKELTTNQNQQILLITEIRKMRKGFYISNAKNNEEVYCQYKEKKGKTYSHQISIMFYILYNYIYSIINNNPFFYFIYNELFELQISIHIHISHYVFWLGIRFLWYK